MPDLAQLFGPGAKYLQNGDALARPISVPKWSRIGCSGRLVELRGDEATACLTSAMGLVKDAQKEGELAVWVTGPDSVFYPPDAAEGGIDLNSLAIVKVPAHAVPRAADKLARSGAFGLIVMDPGEGVCVTAPLQSRLLGLAQKHSVAIVMLTSARSPLAGSLVSLRGEAKRRQIDADLYEVEVHVIKDKRRAPGWRHVEQCHGPAGLR